jgi:topoisomerase-4 subunit B
MSDDLFASSARSSSDYDASSIEVLEGLEPVRRRPGMYIGGTDERALHHLAAEVLDNSMDEAVAGHATRIEVTLDQDNRLTISDNGRGIPVDEHPKFPANRAGGDPHHAPLGGKFSDKAYATSGGLHGVGVSVVNALSTETVVEVARKRELFRQTFRARASRHLRCRRSARRQTGAAHPRLHPRHRNLSRGAHFRPARLYRLARSKAICSQAVEIRWRCDPALSRWRRTVPAEAVFQFPGGLVRSPQGAGRRA